MNSDDPHHPAYLKAREIIAAISDASQRVVNTSNHENPISPRRSSRRSSINSDICYELDYRNKLNRYIDCNTFTKKSEKCSHCGTELLVKPLIFPSLINTNSSVCKRELQFIRAVIWMKSAVQMMKEVTLNDIQELFQDLSPSSLIFNDDNDDDIPSQSSQMVKKMKSQETLIPAEINVKSISNIYNNAMLPQGKHYLIPDYEEPGSPTSTIFSFGENSNDEHTTNNILQTVEDSGIALLDSMNTTSKFESYQCSNYRKNDPSQFVRVVNTHENFKNSAVKKRLKHSEETISAASLSSLIDNLRLNNFVLGEVRIILSVLEKDETIQNYIKNGSMIRDAINTIVQFLNQLITYDDMSSSGVYLQLCTKNIMVTIEKIINRKTHSNLNGVARQYQLITILEFCNCRKLCEEIIDLLITSLTELLEMEKLNWEKCENQPMMNNDAEGHLLCRILHMAVKKYSEIFDLSNKLNENLHHCTTFIWRKFWKNHRQHETPEFRAGELKIRWIRKLEKLIDPEFPMGLAIFGDYNSILKVIRILSN